MSKFNRYNPSVFSEFPVYSGHRLFVAFWYSVGVGTLAGGGVPAIIFIPLALSAMAEGGGLAELFIPFVPLVFTGSIVLPAAIVIGLPLTAILKSQGKECPRIYALCGLLAGAVIPFAIGLAFGSWEAGAFFAIFGMLAGFATALSWGRWRASLRPVEPPPATHKNPFHDMIY